MLPKCNYFRKITRVSDSEEKFYSKQYGHIKHKIQYKRANNILSQCFLFVPVRCWRGYLSGARCRLAYGPADATATHCLLLQYNPDWFYHLGSPGQRAIKRVCVYVCVFPVCANQVQNVSSQTTITHAVNKFDAMIGLSYSSLYNTTIDQAADKSTDTHAGRVGAASRWVTLSTCPLGQTDGHRTVALRCRRSQRRN